jgi:hypothetical protein
MARTFPTSVTRYLGSQFQKKTWFFWHSFLMAVTIGDDVGVLFPWSVHISKYGNPCKYSQKIRKKGGKYTDMHCCGKMLEDLHGLCTFLNIEIIAIK